MPHTDATYNPSSASTHQLVSAANAQTYALSITYGDWGKIQEYCLSQTDLANNVTTSQTRTYSYGSLNEGQTTFAPNNISYADGTNVNEQYGIGGSLQRRETNIPGNQPNEELYRFGADGNLRLYSYDRLFYSLYGYDGGTTRTYKYSFDLNPNWVNGRLESVNFNLHTAMFYPNSYLNFNNDGYYTKHYYNGMERIASRLGDNNLSLATHDPELQDRKWQLDSNIRRNIVDITGYDFLPVGEEQTLEDPKPIYELPVIGISNLLPSADGIYYYHSNHLGSTCYVTDENAIVQQGFLYAPFGEITNEHNVGWQSGTLPKYSFNAKELDEETGMYYYEARYMAPPVFISRDPLFEKYPTFSPYAYCVNNPIKYIDPDGRDTLTISFNSTDKTYSLKYDRGGDNVIVGPDGVQQKYNSDVDVCQYRFYSDGQNVLSAYMVNVDENEDPIYGFAVENGKSGNYMPPTQYIMSQNEQTNVDANPDEKSKNAVWQGYMVFFQGRKFHWGNYTGWSDGCVVAVGKDDINITTKNKSGWLKFDLNKSKSACYQLTEYFGGKKGNQNYKFWHKSKKQAVIRPAVTWGGKQPNCKWDIREK